MKLLSKENKLFLATILITIITISIEIFNYTFIQYYLSLLVQQEQTFGLNLNLNLSEGLIFLFFFLHFSFYFFSYFITEKTKIFFSNKIAINLSKKIFQSSFENYQNKGYGIFLSWFTNDIDQYTDKKINSIFGFFESFLRILGYSIILFLSSWIIGLITLTFIGFGLLIPNFLNKKIKKNQKHINLKNQEYISNINNLIDLNFEFFINGESKNFLNKLVSENYKNYKYNLKFHKKRILIGSINSFYFESMMIIIYLVLGVLILKTNWVPLAFIFLVDVYVQNLKNLGSKAIDDIQKFKSAKTFVEKWNNFLVPIDNYEDHKLRSKKIIFKNFGFSYQKNDTNDKKDTKVISNFNYEFVPNKKHLIFRPSGSGKSTILKTLIKNFNNYQGIISIDDFELRKIHEKQILNLVKYVSNEIHIFKDTFANNISLWDEKIDWNLMNQLKIDCHLDFIKDFNGIIDEDKLSAGQKQRIEIARSLYHHPEILILDESFSNIDQETTKLIRTKLLMNPNLTLIEVTHHYDQKLINQFDSYLDFNQIKNLH